MDLQRQVLLILLKKKWVGPWRWENSLPLYKDRLRCWSHLKRKGKALEESFDNDANPFGCYVLKAFTCMHESIYKMRAMKPQDRSEEATASEAVMIELLMECLKKGP